MGIIPDDVRAKLREPFPPEAIKPHPTKTYLSTIKAIYITERLNDVFGIGGWTLTHEIVSDSPEYVSVRGRIILNEPYDFQTLDQYGGHVKTGTNTEPADGYKSSVTDCLSKCASYLEIGIDIFKGLAAPPKTENKSFSKEPGNQKPNAPSEKQIKMVFAKMIEAKIEDKEAFCKEITSKKASSDWVYTDINLLVKKIEEYTAMQKEIDYKYVKCPDSGDKVEKDYCAETCGNRTGCPEW